MSITTICRVIPPPREFQVLGSLLPTHSGIGVLGPFLVLNVDHLPTKPWPLSVAGLPLFITTATHARPWALGRPGNPRHRVLEHHDGYRTRDRCLYEAVINYFEEEQISISEVVWFFGCWRITLSGASEHPAALPGKICRTTIFYLVEANDRPVDAAFRGKIPARARFDDTPYSPLRPGIMVASKSRLTTSGVFVKNGRDDVFMTVASHGFPDDDTAVYHPNINASPVGEIDHRLGDTDIALMKLDNGALFENSSFQSNVEPNGVKLKGIRDPFEMKMFDMVSMDTPFVGSIDGQFLTVVMRSMPTTSQQPQWVTQTWAWFGQDPSSMPAEGSCGSAIWDEDGYVVSFFRYYVDEDHSGIGVGAHELVRNGYSLC